MKKVTVVAVLMATLIATSTTAASHVPVILEFVSPPDGAVVAGPDVTVVLRASGAAGAASVEVDLMVDGSFVDPATGLLSDRPPAFGGLTIQPGETQEITIRSLGSGRHEITGVIPSHHGGDLEVSRTFFVDRKPLFGMPPGLAVGLVIVLGAAVLAYVNRRRG